MCFGIQEGDSFDFLPHGIKINAQYYINLLHNDVQQVTVK
jgi:hypothetical protein